MSATRRTKDPYVLTACGFGRVDESGQIYDEKTFDGMPVFRLVLDGSEDVALSHVRVATLTHMLAEQLGNCYDSYKHGHSLLEARVAFGGLGFKEFLAAPVAGTLPVTPDVVAEVKEFVKTCKMNQAQRNLFLTIMFGQPVTPMA